MSAMPSQITSLMIIYSGTDQRKHRSPASLAFVWGIHRWPVHSPHKMRVTRKMHLFDNIIIIRWISYSWLFMTRNLFIFFGSESHSNPVLSSRMSIANKYWVTFNQNRRVIPLWPSMICHFTRIYQMLLTMYLHHPWSHVCNTDCFAEVVMNTGNVIVELHDNSIQIHLHWQWRCLNSLRPSDAYMRQ